MGFSTGRTCLKKEGLWKNPNSVETRAVSPVRIDNLKTPTSLAGSF